MTHIDRVPVDVGHAFAQWEHYVDTLAMCGWEIIDVPPADECPDAVFVEDALVTYDERSLWPSFRAMPEPSGAHVVLLGGGRLLVAASCPRSAEIFGDLGYDPMPVDISEFEKLEGCVTCLSVRLRPR